MRIDKSLISILLVFLIVIEGLSNTLFINEFDKQNTSIAYFICGLLIAVLPLIKVQQSEGVLIPRSAQQILLGMGLLGLTYHLYLESIPLFNEIPIDYRLADMLPILKIMCQRFMAGEEVYAIIPEIWGGMQPIYLPALWIPLIPATYFDWELRWTSLFLFVAGLGFILATFKGKSNETANKSLVSKVSINTLIVLVPLFILGHDMMKYESRFFTMTEESIVVFYYLLLAYAVAKEKTALTAIALSLCMLSRYSLAIWAIMYVVYIFFFKDRSKAISMAIIGTVFSVTLMYISQGFSGLHVFLGLQENYINAIINEQEKFQPMIMISMGLAKFYDYENLAALHRIFMITAFAIPIGSLLFYAKFREKINADFFALCSLKLTLVVFYNLLVMPFLYLFFTSTLLSIALLNYYLNYNHEPTHAETYVTKSS